MPDTETSGSEGTSPQYGRAVEAERCWWRRIESEHAFADATETEVDLIRAGRLLGHHHGDTYRRPAFQFDAGTGEILPVTTALLDVAGHYQVPVHDVVMWLCTRSAHFAEQDESVSHLHDPEVLPAAARDEFGARS
ncbi:hypothetical protein ACH9D2_18925 [Kocuria sp. M4R2S49]|uniref:hypothetical protein n=1 Tax=Kocuria rhizosphaericola TaxID=3376284 RepID=UPI0037AE7A9D